MEFSELVKSLRKERDWTQADLAKRAHVSVRTVVRIEKATGRIDISPDAVVRIAVAFERPVEEFLAIAGIVVTRQKLKRLTEPKIVFGEPLAHAQRQSPVALLENVLTKMKQRGGPALLCISVTSDRSIENADTIPIMCELLKAGLWIAVTSPFPDGPYLATQPLTTPSLRRTYDSTFGRACGIARQLQSFIPHLARQIVVMRLNGQPEDGTNNSYRLAAPVLGVTDNRPCVFFYPSNNDKQLPSELEIATYLRYGGDRPDHWLIVYPATGSVEDRERAADVRDNWFDYFGDIISSWESRLPDGNWKLEKKLEKHWYAYESNQQNGTTQQMSTS